MKAITIPIQFKCHASVKNLVCMVTKTVFAVVIGSIATFARANTSFEYEDLQKLIQSKQITTIEELIPQLPEEFRKQFILMHESQSLQPATPSHPRVITFGQNARLILAFNGDRKLSEGTPSGDNPYLTLEVIQFRETVAGGLPRDRFDFFEASFPTASRDKVTFSDVNPSKCMKCHTSDPRPNWEPYNIWPGAFGSLDSFMSKSKWYINTVSKFPLAEKWKIGLPAGIDEVVKIDEDEAFQRFKNNYLSLPRYRSLMITDQKEISTNLLNFSESIGNLNFRRIARKIKVLPTYEKYKYAILGILACNSFSDASRNLKNLLGVAGHFQFARGTPVFGEIASLFNSIFDLKGVSTSTWSMNFVPNAKFAFEDRFGTPGYSQRELAAKLIENDSELENLVPIEHFTNYEQSTAAVTDENCKIIEKRSKIDLQKF